MAKKQEKLNYEVISRSRLYDRKVSINEDEIDYKNLNFLRKFVTEYGKIIPRRTNGVSARHQKKISQAIKLARLMCLLPR